MPAPKEVGNGTEDAVAAASSLSRAVPNAISVFFHPAAGDAMVDAAVRDIVHKLEHGSELLRRGVDLRPR